MSKDESGIVRSQYSNYLGSTEVSIGNSEKETKKHDAQVETVNKKIYLEQKIQKNKDYTYFAEQDAEPGYDMLNGIVSNPSNIDMVDGLVDSEEEIRELVSKESPSRAHALNSANGRASVMEALEKKKEIVQQREKERQLDEMEKIHIHDQEYARG